MLRKLLTLSSSALVAALAVVTVAGSDAATPSRDAALDIELSVDQSQNMSGPTGPIDPWDIPPDPIGPPPKDPCKVIWTCDWETLYPTRSACGAACGGPSNCFQDFNCDGTCICQ